MLVEECRGLVADGICFAGETFDEAGADAGWIELDSIGNLKNRKNQKNMMLFFY